MRRERSAVVTRLVLLVALASFLFAVGKPLLDTGAADGVTLRRCAPEGYGLAQKYVPLTGHARRAVRLTAGWLTAKEKRRSCLLRTTIRVAVAGPTGAVSADWNVNSVRRPWSGVVHTWVWRNWCDGDHNAEPTVKFSVLGGRTVSRRISNPPVCVNPNAPTTVTDLGTGTTYVKRPSTRIPPQILRTGAPPALPYAVLNVENAWLVSDGYTLVAVYAGSPGEHPSIGRFAIVRQNAIFGVQYEPADIVNVGRVGAIEITRAPRGRSRETTAQWGRLAFVSADGTKGILELNRDRVRITGRRQLGRG